MGVLLGWGVGWGAGRRREVYYNADAVVCVCVRCFWCCVRSFFFFCRFFVQVRPMEFSAYPEHVHQLMTYSWKPIIIRDVINELGYERGCVSMYVCMYVCMYE